MTVMIQAVGNEAGEEHDEKGRQKEWLEQRAAAVTGARRAGAT
jgi:hypothetical protein